MVATVSKAFAYYDPDTRRVASTGTMMVEARKELRLELPPNTVDLTDDPDLFKAVRADPSRYRVEDGRIIEAEE